MAKRYIFPKYLICFMATLLPLSSDATIDYQWFYQKFGYGSFYYASSLKVEAEDITDEDYESMMDVLENKDYAGEFVKVATYTLYRFAYSNPKKEIFKKLSARMYDPEFLKTLMPKSIDLYHFLPKKLFEVSELAELAIANCPKRLYIYNPTDPPKPYRPKIDLWEKLPTEVAKRHLKILFYCTEHIENFVQKNKVLQNQETAIQLLSLGANGGYDEIQPDERTEKLRRFYLALPEKVKYKKAVTDAYLLHAVPIFLDLPLSLQKTQRIAELAMQGHSERGRLSTGIADAITKFYPKNKTMIKNATMLTTDASNLRLGPNALLSNMEFMFDLIGFRPGAYKFARPPVKGDMKVIELAVTLDAKQWDNVPMPQFSNPKVAAWSAQAGTKARECYIPERATKSKQILLAMVRTNNDCFNNVPQSVYDKDFHKVLMAANIDIKTLVNVPEKYLTDPKILELLRVDRAQIGNGEEEGYSETRTVKSEYKNIIPKELVKAFIKKNTLMKFIGLYQNHTYLTRREYNSNIEITDKASFIDLYESAFMGDAIWIEFAKLGKKEKIPCETLDFLFTPNKQKWESIELQIGELLPCSFNIEDYQ